MLVLLRTIRHALLDAAFQQTLAKSYRLGMVAYKGPLEPAGEPDHEKAGGMRGTPWRHVALLIQRERLAEKRFSAASAALGRR